MKKSKKIRVNALAASIDTKNEDIRNFMYLCVNCSKPVLRYTYHNERPCVITTANDIDVVLCTNEQCSESGQMKHTSMCNPDYDPEWYNKETAVMLNILKLTKEFNENNESRT